MCRQLKQNLTWLKRHLPLGGKILSWQERVCWVKGEFLDPAQAKEKAIPELGVMSFPRSCPKLNLTGRYDDI